MSRADRHDAARAAVAPLAPMSTASLEHGNAADLDAEDDLGLPTSRRKYPRQPKTMRPMPRRLRSARSLSSMKSRPSATRRFISASPLASTGGLQRWAPGEEPVLVPRAVDPDIKLSALDGRADSGTAGETIAGKDDAARMQSPADRLGLVGKPRARAEKCLANAVYFEARGEPVRGQMAVAQVVMNRVFSGFYPNDVCGVVYQNANRHLACQFTFACDGIS